MGDSNFVSACKPVTENSKLEKIGSSKKISKAAVLACSFPKTAALDVTSNGTSATMNVVIANSEAVARIVLGGTSPSTTDNSKYCKAKAPLVPA